MSLVLEKLAYKKAVKKTLKYFKDRGYDVKKRDIRESLKVLKYILKEEAEKVFERDDMYEEGFVTFYSNVIIVRPDRFLYLMNLYINGHFNDEEWEYIKTVMNKKFEFYSDIEKIKKDKVLWRKLKKLNELKKGLYPVTLSKDQLEELYSSQE